MENFFSIDKLIEFGMSAAVANQMVKSMNQTMNQMQVPGRTMPCENKNSESVYYVDLM